MELGIAWLGQFDCNTLTIEPTLAGIRILHQICYTLSQPWDSPLSQIACWNALF